MRKHLWVLFVLAVFLILLAHFTLGQAQKAAAPLTAQQQLLQNWNYLQNKLVVIAKDVPDDKMDYRPHPDARSFREELWHLIANNQYAAALMKGEKVDAAKLFSNEGKPTDRAEIVRELESSGQECSALIEKNFDSRMIGLLEHAGEHYGKLVTLYRINGIVPPASRPKK